MGARVEVTKRLRQAYRGPSLLDCAGFIQGGLGVCGVVAGDICTNDRFRTRFPGFWVRLEFITAG